ncbi:dihydrodipicolinate synthase family protein, partial [Candidatus Riflebacteria bacterium]
DGLMPYFAAAGARGLVSVASNIWPKQTRQFVELCLAGDFKSLLPVWKIATESLFTASNPIPVKAILHAKGLLKTPNLRPPLSHKDLATVTELLAAHEQVVNWGEEVKKK